MKEANPLIDSIANLTQRAREWGMQTRRPLYAVSLGGAIALSGCSSPSEAILGPETTQSTETPADEPTVDETVQTLESEEVAAPTSTPTPKPVTYEEARDQINEELAENYEDQSGTAAAEYNASPERNDFLESEMQTLGALFVDAGAAAKANEDPRIQQDFFNFETTWRGFGSENEGWGLLSQQLYFGGQEYRAEAMVYLDGDQTIDLDQGVKSLYVERIGEPNPKNARINSAESIEALWGIQIPDGSYATGYLQKRSEVGDQDHLYLYVDGIVAPEMTVGEIQEVDELAVETLHELVAELGFDDAPQAHQVPASDK